ncbi:hypothetical protein [Mesorhizobium sp. DCY119]|uniref:hypothetical protein n=1 Tax=Mesorhizobium sp. DCY119 TaxID=2108445 RepID=UPI001059045B|nr:hypothetical protein [Mesorhizobium sp. DCY119]
MPTPPIPDEVLAARVSAYLANDRNQSKTALALGLSRGALQDSIKRATAQGLLADPVLPVATTTKKSAGQHASARAETMREWLVEMMTGTRYPLINPEAVHVEAQTGLRYDRNEEDYVESERAPKTWVSDTLRVAPVADCRNRKYLFTGAQNDAPVHEQFWTNLRAFAAHIGAEIVVGPWTYETSWFNENSPTSRQYSPLIQDFIAFGQMEVGGNFIFAGEMNTLPTAARPISDLVTYSRGRWAVFPHAKLQLKSVPSTDPAVQAHQVMTTGAVTQPKVIPRKAGIKSIFHHIIGATIVEFDAVGDIFPRQISAADDGSFYDLDIFVSNGKVSTGHKVRAVVCGDVHERKLDHQNALATFGFGTDTTTTYRDNVIDTLQPDVVMAHDVFDNETRSHHHANDNAHFYEMAVRGRDSVMDEVAAVARFLTRLRRAGITPVVVESNHDLGLERYIREGRYRNDGINVRYGLKLDDAYLAAREAQAKALDAGEPVPTFSLLEAAVRMLSDDGLDGVKWVHDGASFVVDGVECGNHGFRGANGSKGTISGFARIGRKMSIGDKHSPEIMDGVYCAGAMNLRHGYNKGPSSWAVAHIVQYPNGKRTLITLQNGKWRAARPVLRVQAANDNEPRRAVA